MSTELLKEVAADRLPRLFYRPKDIKNARVLREAGLVVALFSHRDGHGEIPYAEVLAITEKGHRQLTGRNEVLPVPQAPRASHASLAFLRRNGSGAARLV